MKKVELKRYEYLWTQIDFYCLGPVDKSFRHLFQWGNDCGIYQREIFRYIPVNISDVENIRDKVIKRMKSAGCEIITLAEINNRGDITRIWKDRKGEFVIKRRRNFSDGNEYDVIFHPLSNRVVDMGISPSDTKYRDIVEKMIEVGIEIIKEDEFVLKRRNDSQNDYDIIDQFSNTVIFAEYSGIRRNEMIEKLLDGGVKIITESE